MLQRIFFQSQLKVIKPFTRPVTTESRIRPVVGDSPPLILDSVGSHLESIDNLELFGGFKTKRFDKSVVEILSRPLNLEEIEIRPDGLLFLPEIRYRRRLNEAFGPGNWKLIPRSEHFVVKLENGKGNLLMRDYALICDSTYVGQARGEQEYYSLSNIGGSVESVKSNSLTRCCKDIGIASELWDPTFCQSYKKANTSLTKVTNSSGKIQYIWLKKGSEPQYPFKRA
eukprot:NODE_288_length_10680_cov_0.431245.p7 type:complete len:227 gc:universal NODE_288_length_10680_cov_0.431245:8172-7492(-)